MINEKEIFKRATMRGITEYLLTGLPMEEETESNEDRLKSALAYFDDDAKRYAKENADKLSDSVNLLVSMTTSVYTEIGIQAGMLLMMDLMKNVGFDVRQLQGDEEK